VHRTIEFTQRAWRTRLKTCALARSKALRHFCRDEEGNTLLEFALSCIVLLLLIFGILDCSRALYTDHYVASAARDGTRYAMVRGSSWNGAACTTATTASCTAVSADVTNFVKSVTPSGLLKNSLAVATTWTGKTATGAACVTGGAVNLPGCVVQVKVSYFFNFAVPILPKGTLLLTSTSSMPIAE
jgi:Flp pilus assembly protein TadG